MKLFMNAKFYKRLLIVGIAVYVIYIFVNQQRALATYKNQEQYYQNQVQQEQNKNDALTAQKNNIDSKDYIEQVAREKLDMYLPNERVYVDTGK